jgi:hypothetical protein
MIGPAADELSRGIQQRSISQRGDGAFAVARVFLIGFEQIDLNIIAGCSEREAYDVSRQGEHQERLGCADTNIDVGIGEPLCFHGIEAAGPGGEVGSVDANCRVGGIDVLGERFTSFSVSQAGQGVHKKRLSDRVRFAIPQFLDGWNIFF